MQLMGFKGPSLSQLATPRGPAFRASGSPPSLGRWLRCLRRCRRESGSGCSRGWPGAAERARAGSGGGSGASTTRSPPPRLGRWDAQRTDSGPGQRKDARSEAQGSDPLAAQSPVGPGPQPVPSPAGSPGQHHGRHPGSPSPPGRGLLDSQATSRFTQGLLRLCVQASRPAGRSGPSS